MYQKYGGTRLELLYTLSTLLKTPVRHDRPPISQDGFLDMVAFSLTNYCRVPPW